MFRFFLFSAAYMALSAALFYYMAFRDYGTAGISLAVFAYMLKKQLLIPLIKISLSYMFPPSFLAFILFSFKKTKATHLYYCSVMAVSEFVLIVSLLGIAQKAVEGKSVAMATLAEQADSKAGKDITAEEMLIPEETMISGENINYSGEAHKSGEAANEENAGIKTDLPEDRTFFGRNYVHALPEMIVPPENKKNIILVFMESMEMTFADGSLCGANLIPFLKETAEDNVSFEGFTDGYATNWTQASLIAAMTGLPSSYLYEKTKKGKDVNSAGENISRWLGGVYSLGEILRDSGYERLFVQGGSLKFSGTGKFLEGHGFKDMAYGTDELKDYGKKESAWGIEDKDIYGIFEDKLSKLPQDRPFFTVLATIDTHHYNEPEYVPQVFGMRSKDTIYYADSLIKDFLNRFYLQPYSKDTLLIIAGDHLRMSGGPKSGSGFLKNIKKDKRRIYNVFINSWQGAQPVNRERKMTQIDMFPTILEAAGFKVQGHKLGLGVSVFSEEKTLAEQYSQAELKRLLRSSSPLYRALWQ